MSEELARHAVRPEVLFHYTNASGLLKIIESGELWASDCRFLNDSSEFDLGITVVQDSLKAMGNPALDPSHPHHDIASAVGAEYEGLAELVLDELRFNDHAFVCCFCEDCDLLSQWRGYALRHGYAIGFDTALLRGSVMGMADLDENSAVLMPVEYDPERARQLGVDAVAAVGRDGLTFPGTAAFRHGMALTRVVARIKHRGFAEEREWRAIVTRYFAPSEEHGLADVQFRPTDRAIVPYICIPIDPDAIRSIIVGPSPDQKLRIEGLRHYLDKMHVLATVEPSELPYRS